MAAKKKTTAAKPAESKTSTTETVNTLGAPELVEPGGISSKLLKRREETKAFEAQATRNLTGRK